MDKRKDDIAKITRCLSYLQSEVKLSNSISLFDINIQAEYFYRDLFNLIYDWGLKNLNAQEKNSKFVDLVDSENKKAIQVTSQNDNLKIKEAIEGFFLRTENHDFELKVLLIAKDAKNYTTDFTSNGKYNFDHKKDVIDIDRLLNDINNRTDDSISAIAEHLSRTILLPRQTTESNEVETIMCLIEFLSKDINRKPIIMNPDVDPEKKIYHRFADHSEFITEQYQALYPIYAGALHESKKQIGIDGVKAEIIASYLKDESDDLLNNNNNNPRFALRDLVNYFESKINLNGINGDKQAIRFYLLDELINCNVFPNTKSENK